MTNLFDRVKRGGPNVHQLFARASTARTVTNGPAMMAVLGQKQRAGSVLQGFTSGFSGGLGALPEFTASNADVGSAQDVLTASLQALNAEIQQAQQVQGNIAPLLTRSDAGKLASAVNALEGTIKSTWASLLAELRGLDARRQEVAAAQAIREPQAGDSKYYSVGPGWAAVLAEDKAAWTANISNALNKQTTAMNSVSAVREQLRGWLAKYNSQVPAAADLVNRALVAEQKVTVAAKELAVAKQEQQTTGTDTQTFVLQQQLDQLKAAADATKKQASSAAATIEAGSPNKLLFVLGGAVAIGVGVWLFKHRK